jgi:hypothetical protein
MSDVAEQVNITTHRGYIWHGWSNSVTILCTSSGCDLGGKYVDHIDVQMSAPEGTPTTWKVYYSDYLTLEQILVAQQTITLDFSGCDGTLVGNVGTVASSAWTTHPSGTSICSFKVYGRPYLGTAYFTTKQITYDEAQAGLKVVLRTGGSGTVTATAYAANGQTISVSDGSLLSGLTQDYFPMYFEVDIPAGAYVEAFGVIPDSFYGYVYDSSGNPIKDARVWVYTLQNFTEPTGLTATATGYGNITVYVYKDGDPLPNAKIRVTNPFGLDFFASGATDSSGKLNIIGIDKQQGWDEYAAYTFTAYDLSGQPIKDDFGNVLSITVDFVAGVPQTNPAIIYNQQKITSQSQAFTDSNGYFKISGLPSDLHIVKIYDPSGNLLYEDAVIPPYFKVYGSTSGGGSGDDGGTGEQYGNPDSKYVIILDKHTAKVNEPITVKVKNTKKVWWNPLDPEWVAGADIYVDGVPTGKKTIKPSTGNWLYDLIIGWTTPIVPYTVIQISEPGEHYVYAKVSGEYSQAETVTITGEEYDFKGGADSGTYPGTDPYDENGVCNFRLIYSPTSVKVGGSVTFKVVKVCSGSVVGNEKGMIYVDGEFRDYADPELVYRFSDAGAHTVYAIINTPVGTFRTSEGVITVYDNTGDFIKDDGQSSGINVTVNVYSADTKQPLAGILVQRLAGSQVVEQRKTDVSGKAVLHPVSGHTYNILVSDPSNRYLSQLKEGLSWSADDTLTFYLKPVGDLDGDNSTDSDIKDELTHIEVRVDGFAEDGLSLPPGKHRISVVDQNGKELAGADIYISGDKVGKTGGFGCFVWGCPFGAGLDYDLSEPGEYEIRAEYQSLTDTIYVNITNNVNSYMLIAYPGVQTIFGSGFSDSAMVNSVKVQKGMAVRFEVCEVDSSKPMSEWKRVDNALIFVNGNQTGVTKPIGGWFGFGAVPAYEHTFSELGNYTVYATYGDAKTQTMTVYVLEGEEQGTSFGGVIGELFGQIAKAIPLTGIPMLDTILWAVIVIIGGLLILSVVIRVIL